MIGIFDVSKYQLLQRDLCFGEYKKKKKIIRKCSFFLLFALALEKNGSVA